MEDYQAFLNDLQKRGSKKHHIGHCMGSRDAWKWVRKNKWSEVIPCSSTLYSQIVNEVNLKLIEALLEGHTIELPYQMGKLSIVGVKTKVALEGDKIKDNYRIDWKKTLEYRYKNKAAREEHKLIKRIQKMKYYIRYSKDTACFRHRRLYMFRANRSLVRILGKTIEKKGIIAEEIN